MKYLQTLPRYPSCQEDKIAHEKVQQIRSNEAFPSESQEKEVRNCDERESRLLRNRAHVLHTICRRQNNKNRTKSIAVVAINSSRVF